MNFFKIGFLTLGVLLTSFVAQAEEKNVSIQLLADTKQVSAGQTITIGIEETIKDGWHVYWANPGDSGEPTRITWSGIEGIKAAELQWPIPHKLPIADLVNYGFEKELTLLQDLTFPTTLPEGPITLTADVSLLVCMEICIPEVGTYTITFNDGSEANAEKIAVAKEKLPARLESAATYENRDGLLTFEIPLGPDNLISDISSVEIFPYVPGLVANADKPVTALTDAGLSISQKSGDVPTIDIPQSELLIAYSDEMGNRNGYVVPATLINADKGMAAVPAPAESPSQPNPPSPAKEISFFGALIAALLGGLILNLMPCVFPVLSLKALKLSQLKGKEEEQARLHGLAYSAGVILSFLALAGVLIALKAGGAEIGWGFQLQNPVVIMVLSYLMVLIGLNLSGYFDIGGSFMNAGSSLTQKDGMSGSFFTGVLATVVATPCTAPFMAGAIGYALIQPAYVSLAIFFALGLGLSLPYLALSFIPALRHAMPKPGLWMDTFKQFLAFPMFLFAVWLIWVLGQQAGSDGIVQALLGIIFLSFAIWLIKKGGTVFKVMALIAFLLSLSPLFLVKMTEPSVSAEHSTSSYNWLEYSPAALDEALAGDAPVFINMTAAWCITCKVNEKIALSIADTMNLFAEKNVTYFKGDWTNRDSAITKFLEAYGRNGVPLYVYYGPRDRKTGERPQAVVLPQILTPGIVRDTVLQNPS